MISIPVIDKKGFSASIEDGICTVRTPRPQRRVIGRIPLREGLYRIGTGALANVVHAAAATPRKMTISELHRAANHISHDTLRKMVASGAITGINLDMDSTPEPCDVCTHAKAIHKPFPKESMSDRVHAYGDKIVTYLWGPAEVTSLGGANYALNFLD
ncbi:hypothetical protein FA95DRAFT_1457571, partial [Auriscalpium vulgare]